uniref:Uncharacterized protein n=1 Tax=Anopheles culicifacies TaxID=139723 RepID=A0A182MJK7_9DIPT
MSTSFGIDDCQIAYHKAQIRINTARLDVNQCREKVTIMLSAWQSWLDKQRKKCNKFRWNSCAQPEKAASTEFSVIDHTDWTPGSRHQSLPRRFFGNFRSERNINEEVEQSFLKQFLKEHGLYNKHQTIQQRRRLKYLLELEQRTSRLLAEERADVSILASNTGLGTCLIELHSMPFPERNASPKLRCSSMASPKLRRGSSLSALTSAAAETTNHRDETCHLDEVAVSLPTIPPESKDTEFVDHLTEQSEKRQKTDASKKKQGSLARCLARITCCKLCRKQQPDTAFWIETPQGYLERRCEDI